MRKTALKIVPPANSYWELNIERLPKAIEPALSVWLFNNGCMGTHEKLDFSQPSLQYEAKVKDKKIIDIKAYFNPGDREELEWKIWRWIHIRSPMTRLSWSLQINQDWQAEWKKYFKPFRHAGLQFVPPWEISKILTRSKTVIIEPGMAFGTGTHTTTRFAISLLQKLSQKNKIKNKKILDVGAGSGILSVVAERYGAGAILAIDNDPESWREARKTFKLNKTKKCRMSEKQTYQIKTKYDVVMANIIDGVLMSLKDELWGLTKPRGYIILSGILSSGAKAFIKAFLKGHKAKILATLQDEEWTAYLISK